MKLILLKPPKRKGLLLALGVMSLRECVVTHVRVIGGPSFHFFHIHIYTTLLRSDENTCRVTNLPQEMEEAELRELFAAIGRVSVNIRFSIS